MPRTDSRPVQNFGIICEDSKAVCEMFSSSFRLSPLHTCCTHLSINYSELSSDFIIGPEANNQDVEALENDMEIINYNWRTSFCKHTNITRVQLVKVNVRDKVARSELVPTCPKDSLLAYDINSPRLQPL